jgi:hypothetical protein
MTIVNVEILVRFVKEVEAAGGIPLVVYLPSRGDFIRGKGPATDLIFQAIQDRHLPYVDLAPCMRREPYRTLFLEGNPHYSVEGNALAADCLKPIIQEHVGGSGAGMPAVTGSR